MLMIRPEQMDILASVMQRGFEMHMVTHLRTTFPVMIRAEQMDILASGMQRGFETHMVAHLRTTFPELTVGHSDQEIASFIRYGVERSAAYDITIEGDVERYIEYMMIYGHRFDVDPRYIWAAELLNTAHISGTLKMNRIDDYDQFVFGR